jgi:hypothetical protein
LLAEHAELEHGGGDALDIRLDYRAELPLLPHAQAALMTGSDGVTRLANYPGERGSYSSALNFQQCSFDTRAPLEAQATSPTELGWLFWLGRHWSAHSYPYSHKGL